MSDQVFRIRRRDVQQTALPFPEAPKAGRLSSELMARYNKAPTYVPSPQQSDFFQWVQTGCGNAILEAVAGAGKTTSVVKALAFMEGNVFLGAYNRKAADECKAKAAKEHLDRKGIYINTLHGSCFSEWRRFAPKVEVKDDKVKKLIEAYAAELGETGKAVLDCQAFISKMVSFGKQFLMGVKAPMNNMTIWLKLVDHFSVDESLPDAQDVTQALEWVITISERSRLECKTRVDFDDMIYAPIAYGIRFFQNDWVLIDECFVGDTPILLDSSGKSMTIQEMHETKYTGSILSWDPARGSVISNVIGSKRVPIGRPLVRIKSRRIGYGKNGKRWGALTEYIEYGDRIVVCTKDHKIWTTRGWIAAGELVKGDRVLHESCAPKYPEYTVKYKHSQAGRAALREKGDISRFGDKVYVNKASDLDAVRGGNGRPASKYEKLLLERLGVGWINNYIIPTGTKGQGLPTHYKCDLAHPERRIIIEVDGDSHAYTKEQDARKDSWLQERGWQVVRITNKEVLSITDDLLESLIMNCPVEAEILDVEPWENNKHTHVYDLCIENTHCYYAAGLLVHNCQDINPARREAAKRMLKKGGRAVFIGDSKQAIYGWTGAGGDSIDRIAEEFKCLRLPLTVTYRCPKTVVAYVHQWVSHIQAHPDAPEGVVRTLTTQQTPGEPAKAWFQIERPAADAAILCRYTAPLITTAFALLREGIGCKVEGRDIGQGLIVLARRWKIRTVNRLEEKMKVWLDREIAKAVKTDSEKRQQEAQDKFDTMQIFIERCRAKGLQSIDELVAEIEALFADNVEGVTTLATGHRAKGREWPTVYWLQIGGGKPCRKQWEQDQETNLLYVIGTRAQQELVLVPEQK